MRTPVSTGRFSSRETDFDADSPTLLGFENAGRVSTSQLIDGEFRETATHAWFTA